MEKEEPGTLIFKNGKVGRADGLDIRDFVILVDYEVIGESLVPVRTTEIFKQDCEF